MSEPKWTPGPWRIAEDENNLAVAPWREAIGIESLSDQAAGCVPSLVAWTTRGGRPAADAYLIAAAPELYAALVDARDYVDRQVKIYHAGGHAEVLMRIDAALAKARGEQS